MITHRRDSLIIKDTMPFTTMSCDSIGTSNQESPDLGKIHAIVKTVTCHTPVLAAESNSHNFDF